MAVIPVKLTPAQYRQAIGFAQRLRAAGRRYTRNYASATVDESATMRRELNGACGHRAICVALKRPWVPRVDTFHGADIPPDIGARARFPDRRAPGLCIRPIDPPEHRYVLAVGRFTEWEVVGWLWGWEANRPEWWGQSGGRRVFYVPQPELHDPHDLVARHDP